MFLLVGGVFQSLEALQGFDDIVRWDPKVNQAGNFGDPDGPAYIHNLATAVGRAA